MLLLGKQILEEFAEVQRMATNGDTGRTEAAWLFVRALLSRERLRATHERIRASPARKAAAYAQQARSVAKRRSTPEGLEAVRAMNRAKSARRYAKAKAARASAKEVAT